MTKEEIERAIAYVDNGLYLSGEVAETTLTCLQEKLDSLKQPTYEEMVEQCKKYREALAKYEQAANGDKMR